MVSASAWALLSGRSGMVWSRQGFNLKMWHVMAFFGISWAFALHNYSYGALVWSAFGQGRVNVGGHIQSVRL